MFLKEDSIHDKLITQIRNNLSDIKSNIETIKSQRADAMLAYSGEADNGNNIQGASNNYVSKDIFSSVESIKSQFSDIFLADQNAVYFTPNSESSIEKAMIQTKFANEVFYEKNNGAKFIRTAIHDAALNKSGVGKVFYEEIKTPIIEVFEDFNEIQFSELSDNEEIEFLSVDKKEIEISSQLDNGENINTTIEVYSGEFRTYRDDSKVTLQNVKPENFYIHEDCENPQDAEFCAEYFELSEIEMLSLGIHEDDLAEFQTSNDDDYEEKYGRHRFDNSNDDYEQEKKYGVYEIYKRMDLDNDNNSELYRIIYSGNKIIEIDLVEFNPYFKAVCYPIPYKFNGLSVYDLIKDVQKAKSDIQRMILENCRVTNSGRYIYNPNHFKNPKELLENGMGQMISLTDDQLTELPKNLQETIMPLPISNFNQATFQVLETLEQEKESSTSLSRLAMGLNQDALSSQNSENKIDQLTNNSNKRIMQIARIFSKEFLTAVFKRIITLSKRLDKQGLTLKVENSFINIDPGLFDDSLGLTVNVALTGDEKANFARNLSLIDQQLKNDPIASQLLTFDKRYDYYKKLMLSLGIKDIDSYLLNPKSDEFKQMQQNKMNQQNQQNQAQMQAQQIQLQMQQKQIALLEAQVANQRADIDLKAQEKKSKQFSDNVQFTKEHELDERKFQHDSVIDYLKLGPVKK